MAGISPEQKIINREATKLRDAAFRSRRDAYRSEQEGTEALVRSGDLGKANDAAMTAFNEAIAARNAAVSAIEAKIRELEEEMARVVSAHRVVIEQAKEARDQTYRKMRAALDEAQQAVNAKYPDMDGVYTPGGWKPITEFVPLTRSA